MKKIDNNQKFDTFRTGLIVAIDIHSKEYLIEKHFLHFGSLVRQLWDRRSSVSESGPEPDRIF